MRYRKKYNNIIDDILNNFNSIELKADKNSILYRVGGSNE